MTREEELLEKYYNKYLPYTKTVEFLESPLDIEFVFHKDCITTLPSEEEDIKTGTLCTDRFVMETDESTGKNLVIVEMKISACRTPTYWTEYERLYSIRVFVYSPEGKRIDKALFEPSVFIGDTKILMLPYKHRNFDTGFLVTWDGKEYITDDYYTFEENTRIYRNPEFKSIIQDNTDKLMFPVADFLCINDLNFIQSTVFSCIVNSETIKLYNKLDIIASDRNPRPLCFPASAFAEINNLNPSKSEAMKLLDALYSKESISNKGLFKKNLEAFKSEYEGLILLDALNELDNICGRTQRYRPTAGTKSQKEL